jgi:hypothetical protein
VLECDFQRRSDRNAKHIKQVSRVGRKNEDFDSMRLECSGSKQADSGCISVNNQEHVFVAGFPRQSQSIFADLRAEYERIMDSEVLSHPSRRRGGEETMTLVNSNTSQMLQVSRITTGHKTSPRRAPKSKPNESHLRSTAIWRQVRMSPHTVPEFEVDKS